MNPTEQTKSIDRSARIIARHNGNGDATNPAATWERTVRIRATFGAGTNSTYITRDDIILYEANDYGNNVTAFRFGAWCARLKVAADETEQRIEQEKATQEAEKAKETASRFVKIDF